MFHAKITKGLSLHCSRESKGPPKILTSGSPDSTITSDTD